MIKNIRFLILTFLFSYLLFFPCFKVSAATTFAEIKGVQITVDENGVIKGEGLLSADATNANLIVKIFNSSSELEYFNQIVVTNNYFKFSATPLKATNGSTLTLKILGDMTYSTTFYYSSEFDSEAEENESDANSVLDDYSIYYDDVLAYKLKFNIIFTEDSDYGENYVFLRGTNFARTDSLWKDKDATTWENYLRTIMNKVKTISKQTTYIYVYDKVGNLIQTYPLVQEPTGSAYITPSTLQSTLGTTYHFKSNSYSYSFNYVLMNEGNAKYIKIKAIGDFSKTDAKWKAVNYADLEVFSESIAKQINKYFNADIDVFFYDSNNSYLTSYNYYYYISDDVEENKDNFEFIPWDDTRATGLVLMLRVTDYGKNSKEIIPMINEGMTAENQYTYKINVNTGHVVSALNELRADSQKILVINQELESNNVILTINSAAVNSLKNEKALMIFDCNNFKVELDFSKIKTSGEIVLKSLDVAMETDSYAKPIGLNITVDGKNATEYFSNGIKCLLHYESEKTREINDLRSINIYNSKNTMMNTTATTLEKGFIFRYDVADIYYAKSSQHIFTDIKDVMLKQYAQLVASKRIIFGENNGKFNPDTELTRGDFISYIANKLGVSSKTSHFSDVKNDYTYYEEVNGVYELGILPSTYKNTLKPNQKITKEEMIYIIVRCYEINNSNNQNIKSASLLYRDKADIDIWAKTKIGIAAKLKIIPTDGYLYPKEVGTKLYAAELFYWLLVAENIF